MKKILSKNLLGIALACALLTLAIAPNTLAAGSSAVVSVDNNNLLTLALNNQHATPSFQGLIAFTNNQGAFVQLNTSTTPTGDWIRVVDYTGTGAGVTRGHKVNIVLNTGTWTYGGQVANVPNLTNRSTSVVSINQAAFKLTAVGGVIKSAPFNADLCGTNPADATLLSPLPGGFLSKSSTQIINNTEACASTFWYTFNQINFIGPSNKLAPGTYQNTATITLIDGGNS